MVCIKFLMIWTGVFWGASTPMLYLIFWFQAILNVVNCFILHSIVLSFHKGGDWHGSVARFVFFSLFISLWFQVTYVMGDTQTPDGTDLDTNHLQCSPKLYPLPFLFLYLTDFTAGVVSVSLWFKYDKNIMLRFARKDIKDEMVIAHEGHRPTLEDDRLIARREVSLLRKVIVQQQQPLAAFITKDFDFEAFHRADQDSA
jgi:hypothetical protein